MCFSTGRLFLTAPFVEQEYCLPSSVAVVVFTIHSASNQSCHSVAIHAMNRPGELFKVVAKIFSHKNTMIVYHGLSLLQLLLVDWAQICPDDGLRTKD